MFRNRTLTLGIIIIVVLSSFMVIFKYRTSIINLAGDALFSYLYPATSFKVDLNGDNKIELIKIFTKFESYDGVKYTDNVLSILVNNKDRWERALEDRCLGSILLDHAVRDINLDGFIEFISIWGDGNAVGLRIYGWNGHNCKEIFSGGGKDVKLADIDHDGIEEIFEYFRDYDKPIDAYVVTMHKWDKKLQTYILKRESIPVEIDKIHGDRLILGKGKSVILK